jgi:hypothetical protein
MVPEDRCNLIITKHMPPWAEPYCVCEAVSCEYSSRTVYVATNINGARVMQGVLKQALSLGLFAGEANRHKAIV